MDKVKEPVSKHVLGQPSTCEITPAGERVSFPESKRETYQPVGYPSDHWNTRRYGEDIIRFKTIILQFITDILLVIRFKTVILQVIANILLVIRFKTVILKFITDILLVIRFNKTVILQFITDILLVIQRF